MDSILKVSNLSISIAQRELVKNASFEIRNGDAILLSGENGAGKSSLLKTIISWEMDGKDFEGEIIYKDYGNVLSLDESMIQKYRSEIAYIEQKDEYNGNIRVMDIVNASYQPHTGKNLSSQEVNNLIDEWLPRRSDNSRLFDAKSKPAKFSGGEQRLLSVFSIIATRSDADLLIIDEPLNNLDFVNAKHISNLINKVMRKNNHMGLLMISHCRIFPFITRELRLSQGTLSELKNHYECHSCFGEPDEEGYYK